MNDKTKIKHFFLLSHFKVFSAYYYYLIYLFLFQKSSSLYCDSVYSTFVVLSIVPSFYVMFFLLIFLWVLLYCKYIFLPNISAAAPIATRTLPLRTHCVLSSIHFSAYIHVSYFYDFHNSMSHSANDLNLTLSNGSPYPR